MNGIHQSFNDEEAIQSVTKKHVISRLYAFYSALRVENVRQT